MLQTRHVILIVLVALLSGCANTYNLRINPRVDAVVPTAKLPVHAGIYYSPQFSSQTQTRTFGSDTWVAPIGAASAQMFDAVFPRVFEQTSPVPTPSADAMKTAGVDFVVSPSLEHFDFLIGLDKDSDRYSVIYRMTLYSPDGVPVSSWLVPGNKPSKAFTIWGMIEDDMVDAAGKLVKDFEHHAGQALAAIERGKTADKPVPLELQDVTLTATATALPGLNPQQLAALQSAGIVSVRVTAQSRDGRDLAIHASSMRLKLASGETLEPLTVSQALSALDRTSQAGGVTAALTNPLFGMLVTYDEQRTSQSAREAQFKAGSSALFGDRSLAGGEGTSGMVLFKLPSSSDSAQAATLTVWVVEPATASGKQLEFPLE